MAGDDNDDIDDDNDDEKEWNDVDAGELTPPSPWVVRLLSSVYRNIGVVGGTNQGWSNPEVCWSELEYTLGKPSCNNLHSENHPTGKWVYEGNN